MKGTNDGTPPDQPKKHLLAADSSIAPKACVGRVPSGSCEPPLAQDRHGHCKQKEELAVPRAVIGCKQRVITAAPRARQAQLTFLFFLSCCSFGKPVFDCFQFVLAILC